MIPSDKKALQQRSPTKTDRVCRKLLRLGLIQTFLGFSCTVLACVCLDHLRHHHVLAALSGGALFCSFCLTVSGIIETAGGSRWMFSQPNMKSTLLLVCLVESIVFVPGAIGFFGRICFLINTIRRHTSEVSPDIDFPAIALAVVSPVAGTLAFIIFGLSLCTAAILYYHEPPACLQVHTISYNPDASDQPLIVQQQVICSPDIVIEDPSEYISADITFERSYKNGRR